MTAYGQIPQDVLDNAERRLRAGRKPRMCVTPGCTEAATHSPCTGHDSCETHRITPPMPSVDPLRAEAYLRATRGQNYTPSRTVFDTTVEAKGQRIGAARRAYLRGDNDPTEATL
jgi:hypothetical protein